MCARTIGGLPFIKPVGSKYRFFGDQIRNLRRIKRQHNRTIRRRDLRRLVLRANETGDVHGQHDAERDP